MKPGINLDSLLVLDAVVRCGSFAAAAEELHRVPSTVTYSIKKLEEGLGVELFDRQGHRAVLTPAGEALLQDGRDLLMMAERVGRTVRGISSGWEKELRIAAGDLITTERLLELCQRFYREHPESTRLRVSSEVFGGSWDALLSDRADLAIGAPGAGPAGGGFTAHPIGEVEFLFVVAPHHPLAQEPEPLRAEVIGRYRVVAAADSSRGLPPRSYGLLPGQPVFTVPDMQVKYRAQLAGLGVGHLPRHIIQSDLDAGRLLVKVTEEGTSNRQPAYAIWRTRSRGNALAWFQQALSGSDPIDWFG